MGERTWLCCHNCRWIESATYVEPQKVNADGFCLTCGEPAADPFDKDLPYDQAPPMSSDVKIPEWAREEAAKALGVPQDDTGWHLTGDILPAISNALLAAEQRGRKAGIEEAATVAEGYDGDGLIGSYDCHLGDARLTVREIAAAIRSLGDHHDR